MTDEAIRGAGFSRSKLAAIRDISAKTLEGIVPTTRQITKLEDDEIVERLIQVRGVGTLDRGNVVDFSSAVPTFCRLMTLVSVTAFASLINERDAHQKRGAGVRRMLAAFSAQRRLGAGRAPRIYRK